jgi:hypothetical protein
MSNSLISISPGLLKLVQSGGGDSFLTRELTILECEIAGTSFQKLDVIEPLLKEGDRFLLIREAENKYDKWAVAFYTIEKQKLGYLPKDKNEAIARLLDAGKTIFGALLSKKSHNNWLQLSVKIILVE